MPSQELIKELQVIIEEDYGKAISLIDATSVANGLVGYFDLLAKLRHLHEEHMTARPPNCQTS